MPSPASTPGQQRPRAPCDECRRLKLRCDGEQPQCGVCQQAGRPCETKLRGARGPKKGYLTTLKNRLVQLEAALESRLGTQQQQQQEHDDTTSTTLITYPVNGTAGFVASDRALPSWRQSTAASPASVADASMLQLKIGHSDLVVSSEWSTATPAVSLVSNIDDMHITDAVHTELDQLYFDRVHPSIPILHQQRYISWSRTRSNQTASRKCLQYAMWTLSTLMSAQFRDMTDPLYRSTKHILESCSLGGNEHGGVSTELVQAWVLVATCESMRTDHGQAWMSAGRAFRLVQVMRLHEIDSPKPRNSRPKFRSPDFESDDFTEVEEKRRVFWMAYFLDHLFTLRNDWPITLNEHMICTRLPIPDPEFQSNQNVLGNFLSEAMTQATPEVQSSFNECLIFVTICGRSLLDDQKHNISKAYGDTTPTQTTQSRWLEDMLAARLQVLSQFYPSPTAVYDPLLLFANILGQTTVIYQCKGILESAGDPATSQLEPVGVEIIECQNRLLGAAESINRLGNVLRQLHFSKVHPLMPLPLFLTAEVLYENLGRHDSFSLCLLELVDIFRALKNVNNHDESYLSLLPQSCISATAHLFNGTTDCSRKLS